MKYIIPLLLLTTTLFYSCSSDTEEQYMHIEPQSTVYDIASGIVVDGGAVSLKDMIIDVQSPLIKFSTYNGNSSMFINTAYAMHKDIDRFRMIEKITAIRIYTVRDYNAQYKAGNEISGICELYAAKSNTDSSKSNPIPAKGPVLKNDILRSMNQEGYIYEAQKPLTQFLIKLNVAPATASVQEFKIEFETGTPSKFHTITKSFILKP